jgi:hypothetical protein
MTYEEAMQEEVSREEARREILRHGHDPEDFFREVGDRLQYPGAEVLEWLGY